MKAFSIFLQDYQQGRTHAELTDALDQLLQAVRDTGRGGSLSLTIKIKPTARGSAVPQIVIEDEVKSKLPKYDRGSDFFYLTDAGEPTREHPKQHGLDLKQVGDDRPSELRKV